MLRFVFYFSCLAVVVGGHGYHHPRRPRLKVLDSLRLLASPSRFDPIEAPDDYHYGPLATKVLRKGEIEKKLATGLIDAKTFALAETIDATADYAHRLKDKTGSLLTALVIIGKEYVEAKKLETARFLENVAAKIEDKYYTDDKDKNVVLRY